ncbi:ABC-2 transporter permease [Faecalibaculum rodentium]|uniref:ABC-2 transporter permease n=3 Tax=Faecalibaculum rodentium TaxID=1702221 RepID=UPI0025A5F1E1|nr:ABC-2 transporter permease [Faecalibaculum rodentium]
MKGLALYDLTWLKGQKKLLMILTALTILYLVTDGTMVLFLSVIFQMLLLRTLEWNLRAENRRFLFTLPFTRRQYVQEKYLFILGSTLVLTIGLYILALAFHPNKMMELTAMLGVILLELLYFSAILIPMMIKLGSNMQVWLTVIVVAIASLTALMIGGLQETVTQWLTVIQGNLPVVFGGMAVLGLVCLGVSMKISEGILGREEL